MPPRHRKDINHKRFREAGVPGGLQLEEGI